MKIQSLVVLLGLSFSQMGHALNESQSEDLAEFLGSETNYTLNLNEMSSQGLDRHNLEEDISPWSGPFWPDRGGSIVTSMAPGNGMQSIRIFLGSNRADRLFSRRQNQIERGIMEMSQRDLNDLSPAEKYDLFMGDTNFTFSKNILNGIDDRRDYVGAALAFWSGICNGWAPASIHMKRPSKAVTLPILNGTRQLTFYPDDLKALASFLWDTKANTDELQFSGYRCNLRSPNVNRRTGLTFTLNNPSQDENECGDMDPVTFHLVTINRIGVQKRSFIADVDYNSVVNNHPIKGYTIRYFNPVTGDEASLEEAKVLMTQIRRDPLADYRHESAHSVVGVEMTLKVAHWQHPTQERLNTIEDDEVLRKKYIYQLELDEEGNIVSGQWRTRKRDLNRGRGRFNVRGKPSYPDFIWSHTNNFIPREFAHNDRSLDFDLSQGVTEGWTELAKISSDNQIKLLESTRIRYPQARRAGIFDRATALAEEQGIEIEEAATAFAEEMNQLGIPTHKPNPQVLSDIVYGLFDLANE